MDEGPALRTAILNSLRKQGYRLRKKQFAFEGEHTKDGFRRANEVAVRHKVDVASKSLARLEPQLLTYIANGTEVMPEKFSPRLVEVKSDTEDEKLFRYACCHWSIPVSSGYGRRIRFLVFDDCNGKLIGLFGLGDPVYAMRARDEFIGWSPQVKKEKLYHIMDAYVLGAVPPYSRLLCGKLIALLVMSNEVRAAFRRKYAESSSLISGVTRPPYLAMVTTTSALGRSSIYNRLRHNGTTYWKSVGFTLGSGEFHFCNGVYSRIRDFVHENCEATAKTQAWGSGYRNRREVIRKCLMELNLPRDLLYHGIRREIFVAPLGCNSLRFLRGELTRPGLFNWPARELCKVFIQRWLLPRATRCSEYRDFTRDNYALFENH